MKDRWNAEAAAAMARRARLNGPEKALGRPGDIIPIYVVDADWSGRSFCLGMIAGALTAAAGYFLPNILTIFWRLF